MTRLKPITHGVALAQEPVVPMMPTTPELVRLCELKSTYLKLRSEVHAQLYAIDARISELTTPERRA